ncbi:rhomboid family intramembrane serine protease [Haloterrigena alkaliphila]|uniref:Rhomboid family intramembrane serine protease n=1 Tax=Haloterrigena alkaliphila TaxID=2816475 RepID=A0A8A2VBT4_9EURY|nr:rhomboid family intramembrane serine protease [Haloterrigena alkaliphila]QSW98177.1 rhomboid family intramembrane serine protease [Haloterrigena alkaliphila]
MADQEEYRDAASKSLAQANEAETWREWVSIYRDFFKAIPGQVRDRDAPVTAILILITITVFILQSVLYLYITESFPIGILVILTQRSALTGLTAYLFVDFPWIAWPLAEFLHKGVGHFVANIALLALFGKIIESRFQTRYYILWFVGVAIIVKPIDALITLSTSPKPNVAVYGISDFVYSLGIYTVMTVYSSEHGDEIEYLGMLVGVAAIIQILVQATTAVHHMSIQPLNTAHLFGGLLGIVVFGIVRKHE